MAVPQVSSSPGPGEASSTAAGSTGSRADRAIEALEANPVWYHSIELAPGVVSQGQVDLRSVASRVLPDDLTGRRALDVGTFDGFWAFEMERRGAEVIAVDVERVDAAEWPPLNRNRLERVAAEWDIELGRGFRLAAAVLGSRARRIVCNVYDLAPEAIGGPVDFAFAGAIMLHLRDPVRALEKIRGVLAGGGELRSMEPFSPFLTLASPRRPAARFQALETDFNWWVPNLAALRAWPRAAGFARARRVALLRPESVRAMRQPYAVYSCPRGG